MRWPLLRVAVAERSMQPTLQPGDWLLVLRTGRGLPAAPSDEDFVRVPPIALRA